jgi:hypothetical protein
VEAAPPTGWATKDKVEQMKTHSDAEKLIEESR